MKLQEIEPLFLPASFFMARTPVLPLESFYKFCNQPELLFSLSHVSFEEKNLILEAIAVASPSLYSALSQNKETDQTVSSLIKYYSRMTTRSTPFGLFSFVSMGQWGPSTLVHHDLTQIQKRVRPDMEWLCEIVGQVVANSKIKKFLLVQSNPLIFKSGNRISLDYYRKKNQKEGNKFISIKSSFLTQALFEIASKFIKVDDLLDLVIDRFPFLIREKVAGIVDQLIEQQYLMTHFQPSLLSASPFQDFLKKLESSFIFSEPLQEIVSKINHYQKSSLGDGFKTLLDVEKMMKKEKEVSNVIQVDSFNKASTVQLFYQIGEALSEAVELLWRMSNDFFFYPLHDYHEKFLEKYGPYRAVPLIELLHEERGLGIPKNYLEHHAPEVKFSQTLWRKWLKERFFTALHEKEYEVILTKDLFEKILKKSDPKKALPSFDLFFEVIADSVEKIDKGEGFLLLGGHVPQGGATFGRFVDVFDEDCYKKLKTFFIDEEALNKEALVLQSSYLPSMSRSANVAIQPELRKHSVDLEGRGNMALSDVYVRVDSDRFYLTLKDGSKEIIVTSCNVLNSTTAPIPIRFLLDISSARYKPCFPFSWMVGDDVPFLPRVRYKNIIFHPAIWKVDLFRLGLEPKANKELVQQTFQEWADLWKMPRYVYMGEGDQKILIDRGHPALVQEVISQLKKEHVVTLIEKVDQEKSSWIQSQLGTHASEFVLPFVKNPKYAETNPFRFPICNGTSILAKDRWKVLGSEWLFIKCYLSEELENRFLTEEFHNFISNFVDNKTIKEWFFIRYADPKSHLRFRFKGNDERLITQFIPALHSWLASFLEQGYFSDITFSTYEREIERYGGIELINEAESLFCIDSSTILSLLKKKTSLAQEVLASLSLIDFLKSLGLSLEGQLSFYAALSMPKEELVGFREHKILILSLGQAILENRLSACSDIGPILSQAFLARSDMLLQFASNMNNKKSLSLDPHEIINSIIHMHCNRLLGKDGKKELKARLYAYETLKIINRVNSNACQQKVGCS